MLGFQEEDLPERRGFTTCEPGNGRIMDEVPGPDAQFVPA